MKQWVQLHFYCPEEVQILSLGDNRLSVPVDQVCFHSNAILSKKNVLLTTMQKDKPTSSGVLSTVSIIIFHDKSEPSILER